MSKHNAACCGCGWTGRMEHAMDHISYCQAYADRLQDDPDDECLDPGNEWERRQREQDGQDEETGPVSVPDGGAAARRRAGKRAENIRKAGVFLVETYAAAVLEKDWDVMGYTSVEEWRDAEFGMFRMLPEARREAAQLMLEGGQAVPGIAAATGASESAIRGDLAGGNSTESGEHSAAEPAGASPSATVSDKPQVSEPPKVTAKPEPVTPVTPARSANASRQARHRERKRQGKAAEKTAKVSRHTRETAGQAANGGGTPGAVAVAEDPFAFIDDEPVSAGSTPNSSSSAEDGRPGGTAGHECVCPECGQGRRQEGREVMAACEHERRDAEASIAALEAEISRIREEWRHHLAAEHGPHNPAPLAPADLWDGTSPA